MHSMLTQCPVCAGPLHVSEVACAECGTRVQSVFAPSVFCNLSPEQIEFVELFLRCRGDLGGVADELDTAYSTVSRNLDAILAALRLPSQPGDTPLTQPAPQAAPSVPLPSDPAADAERMHILEMLDRGEITAEDATRRLKDL